MKGPLLTGTAAGVGTGAGAGLGGWGMVLEPAWEERLSLTEGGEGNRGITGGTEGFFLLEGGTRGGGRDMGTGSPSRALYTRYMAWERATQINDKKAITNKPSCKFSVFTLPPHVWNLIHLGLQK